MIMIMIKTNTCHYISIVRLQNRVSLDISNILTAVNIFTHIPPPSKSSNPDLTHEKKPVHLLI